MIKHFYRSKSDIENLSRLRTIIPNGIDTFNYKRIVVNKPWGYEYLLFENECVAIWILYLKNGYSTSMHCHPNKKSSQIVLFGKAICSTLEGWTEFSAGQGAIIDETVFHSIKAVSKEGVFLMELETPPNKKDLVRLKDGYGREQKGYEGEHLMSRRLKDYEYIDFHSDKKSKKSDVMVKTIRQCSISLQIFSDSSTIHQKLKEEKGHIICMLKGKLHDINNGNVVLAHGEVALLSDLISYKELVAFGETICLLLNYA